MMNTDNKNIKGTITGIAVTVAALALFIAVSIYIKGYDLYLFGVVWKDAGVMWYIIYVMPVLLMHVLRGEKSRKRNADEDGHGRTYLTIFLIMFLASVVFLGGLIAEGISGSRKTVIAEVKLDDGRNILLAEKEEHLTISEGSFNNVTIYRREALRLKKIGEFSEFNYTNNHMIRDNQYRVEQSGDTLTIYFDYGSLTEGMEWRDEAPEYIIKEYNIGK